MKKHERKTKATLTQVTQRNEASQGSHAGGAGLSTLEPIEEKVIRMLRGLSEDDSAVLEFAVGASADARQRMALMEACNIADLDGQVPLARDAEAHRAELGAIVARYQGRES